MTAAAGLALRAVSLTVGDGTNRVTVLDAVDLTVAAGEFVAVVGPSGSGKSSLLAVAGGLCAPDVGTVRVDGRDPAAGGRPRTVGFLFQSGNLIPALTALDQLRLITRIGGRALRGRVRDPRELLNAVGMLDKADRRPHQLSGGERQRVGIARALMAGPSLLLIDEPTAALDRARSHDVVRLLARETKQYGVATVMVTHDQDVLRYCDRVHEMVDGTLT